MNSLRAAVSLSTTELTPLCHGFLDPSGRPARAAPIVCATAALEETAKVPDNEVVTASQD